MTNIDKFLGAIGILFIGILIMPSISYLVGLFVIPLLVGASAYIIYKMVKTSFFDK